MVKDVAAKLADLNIELPEAPRPAANYLPYVVSGHLVYVSGQLPMSKGAVAVTGRLGAEVDVVRGKEAARLCAINILSQVRAACGGDLDRVRHCLRIGGFVACTPEFADHPKVVNGASDLMVEVFGEAGRHARAAVGVASLPMNAAVEVEAVFDIA